MRTVASVATSFEAFGQRELDIYGLLAGAGRDCLERAPVSPGAIDHLYVSNMASGEFEGKTGIVNALAHDLNLHPTYTARIDQTSASGGAGVYAAWQSIASNASEATLLVGGEKMSHQETAVTTDVISSLTHPVEYKHGVTLPSFGGLAARRYMADHGASRASLSRVGVKNHRHAVDNPHAQFRTAVTLEEALESPVIAAPLRLYDFCPVSDGAAAILFCSESLAREYDKEYAVVTGIGGATDTHVVHERTDLTRMRAVRKSSAMAYEMADSGSDDIDVAELHDTATVLELIQSEELGFFDRGTAWQAVERGQTSRDGSLPINPSGGLKARGHPLGATGVAQVCELHRQVLGRAGKRQVTADVGLACNVGGFGNCVMTTILERGV